MTRIRTSQKAPLFEELEPRLLFSADVVEPVAAEAVQEALQEEPVIIIAETSEHADNPVDIGAEPPVDTPSSAEDHQPIESISGSTELGEDTSETNSEIPLSQSDQTLSVDTSLETTGITADSASNSSSTQNSEDETLTAAEASLQPAELILINDNVRDIDQLIAGFVAPEDSPDSIEVIILDTVQDGIQQVGDILADYDNLDAIHLFTHGRGGSLALGGDWLTASDLHENSEAVSGWGEALSEDGDILLYGCSIASGEAGHDFVDSLAVLTSADVSASDDPTGQGALGGDWELEYSTGPIDAVVPLGEQSRQDWEQLLVATIGDDFSSGTYDGNTGTVSWNNDWQEINEADGALGGNVSIYSHPVFGSQPILSLWKDHVGIWREADLSGATTAALSFDWGFYSVDAGDSVTLEISTDGGTTWNPIDTFSGPGDHSSLQAASYDISSHIDNDTRIKFETATFGDNDEFAIDNIQISFSTIDQALWLSTDSDTGSGNGVAGLDGLGWDKGDILQQADPNFALGETTTDGTFSIAFDIETFSSDANAVGIHYVSSDVTFGGDNQVALQTGDLVLAVDGTETFMSNGAVPEADLTVSKEDLFYFRPDAAGDYSQGNFYSLLPGVAAAGVEIRSITLIESDVRIGDRDLSAGDLLFSTSGGSEDNDILLLETGTLDTQDVGTYPASLVLVEGDDPGVDIEDKIYGLEVLETDTVIGGQYYTAGTILLTLDGDDTDGLGGTGLLVNKEDIAALNLSQTTLVSGNAAGEATLLFDGSDVNFDSEKIDAISVWSNSVNRAPSISGDDTGSITEDVDPDSDTLLETSGALAIVDPDAGESLFVAETVTGTYGELTVDTIGNWSYAADNTQISIQQLDSGENVIDTLTVTTADGTSHDVEITINGVEDDPVIGGIAAGTVTEDGSLTASESLTITDTDTPDNPISFDDVGPAAGSGGYGSFQMSANIWSYTLDNGLAAVQALNGSDSLTDTYTFSATDGSTQLVTITINGSEDTPGLSVNNPLSVPEESSRTITPAYLTAADNDNDASEIIFTLTQLPGGTGSVILNSSSLGLGGTFTQEDIDNNRVTFRFSDDASATTFKFTLFDGTITTPEYTFNVNGAPVNDAPVVTLPAAQTVLEETATALSGITISDIDAGGGDLITRLEASAGVLNVTLSGGATISAGANNSGDLTISGTVDDTNATLATLSYIGNTNVAGIAADTLTVTADDGGNSGSGGALQDVGTVQINISNVDDAPVIAGTDTGSVTEDLDPDLDTLLEIFSAITITDPDAGESSFEAETITGTYGDLIIDTSGNWSYSASNNQTVIQQLDFGQSLTDTMTVTTADGTAHDIVITINGAEDPPVIGGTTTGTVAEDGTLTDSGILTITDTDTSDNPIAFLDETATLGDNGYGTFEITANSWTYALNNGLGAVQALGAGETLTDIYTFSAVDGSTQLVSITINGTEDPPVIGGTALGTVSEDGTLTDSNTLSITDADTNDNPIFFINETAAGDNGYGTFEISSNTWTYTLDNALNTVQALDDGESLTDTYLFSATDGSTQRVTVTINGMEDAPVLQTAIPDQNASEDLPFSYTIGATVFADPDTSDSLTYTAALDDDSPLPAWLNFNEVTRTFSGTPEEADIGAVSIKVTADDGIAAVADIFTITVVNTNDTPAAVDDTKETTRNTPVVTDNVLNNDTLGDGLTDISSFDTTSSLGGTIVYNNDGTFTYTPASDFTGVDTFTYTITDADGEMSVATVTVNVNEPAVTVTGPVDPVEPGPDPLVPDPETTNPEEIPVETPAEETVPVVQTTPVDEYVETAVTEEPADEPSEPTTVTADKSIKDPVDKARTAAQAGSAANDPAILTTAGNDGSVPDDLSAPVKSDTSGAATPESASVKKIGAASSETTTLLLKRYLDHINFLSEVDYSTAIENLRDALDEFKEEAESEEHYYKTVIGSAIAVSTGLSVGYVAWLIRGGMLLSSMLFSMPAWQLADPLPLLAGARDDEDEDEETLETIIKDNAKPQQKKTGEDAKSAENHE